VQRGPGRRGVHEREEVQHLLALVAQAEQQRLGLVGGQLQPGRTLEGDVRLPEGPGPVRMLALELVQRKDAQASVSSAQPEHPHEA
jgi:hypothetical protein